MYDPHSDPTDRRTNRSITWTNVLLTYALAAAIPVLLWAVSAPGAAALAGTVTAVAAVATRYGRRLASCVDRCRGVSFTVPRTARVSVCWGEPCRSA